MPGDLVTGGAAQAFGNFVAPIVEASKGVGNYALRRYRHCRDLQKNCEELTQQAEILSSHTKDVNVEISNKRLEMKPTYVCELWLQDVEKNDKEVEKVKAEYDNFPRGFRKSIGRINARVKLSRKILKLTDEAAGLSTRMKEGFTILAPRSPPRALNMLPGRNHLVSFRENVEKLTEYLNDDSIQKIGIWGLTGVGKTKILRTLNNDMEKSNIFDIVIWVNVPKDFENLLPIQHLILKRLKVNVEGLDQNDAADTISRHLENKKYLVILDDVCSKFNVHELGILVEDSRGHAQGKVVVATREKGICDKMDLDEEMKVDKLSEDDAWELFSEIVGEEIKSRFINPIALVVLKHCGGIPQVIRAIGTLLKNESSEDIWKDMSLKLESPSEHIDENLSEVLKAFQILCDNLEGDIKNCLLYGASFPEDHEINGNYLIECWKSNKLIDCPNLKTAYQIGNGKLKTLVDKCLLDRCKKQEFVKMPIIFRDAAVKVARQVKFELWVRDKKATSSVAEWKDAKVVSWINSSEALPDDIPECPNLLSLFLQNNQTLLKIPASYFHHMSLLTTLDLYGTAIEELPGSISKLENLKLLYLNDCGRLMQLCDEVGKLHNLEALDICRTGIKSFPVLIKMLTSLQCLRVSFRNCSLGIQDQAKDNKEMELVRALFAPLRKLEEVIIVVEHDDQKWSKVAPAIAEELAKLNDLMALSFHFPNTDSLAKFTKESESWKTGNIRGSNFRSFNFCVGQMRSGNSTQCDASQVLARRFLQYHVGEDIPVAIKEVLTVANAFKLINYQSIASFSDFGIQEMEELKFCIVEECGKMTTLIGNNVTNANALPRLEELRLLNLQQLTHICSGVTATGSFAELKTLTLHQCPILTEVISAEMAKQLTKLQYLRVEDCPGVTVLFVAAGSQPSGRSQTGTLEKLESIEIINLDNLESVHSDKNFHWQGLQKLDIVKCDTLSHLCLSATNAPKLHFVRCSEAWWAALQLSNGDRAYLNNFVVRQ